MADSIGPSSQAGNKAAARFVLRLFVAGATEQSKNAICNVKNVCEQHLKDRYELQVIDVFETPVLAVSENIVATPTLVLPRRRRKLWMPSAAGQGEYLPSLGALHYDGIHRGRSVLTGCWRRP